MITPSFGLTATERVLPKLALDFTTASLDPRITFTRSGNTATYTNSSGVITAINADLPRFDYNPTTLVCQGLLIEESRKNLFLNSLIDGTNLTTQIVTTTATATTISFYGTGSIVLSGTHSATVTGTGAYPSRKTYTFTPTAGALTCTVSGTVQYAQIEAGAFATSFIPTDATVGGITRNADIATMTGTNFNSWYNQSEGAFEIDANYKGFVANEMLLTVTDGAFGAFMQSYWFTSTGIQVDSKTGSGSLWIAGAMGTDFKFVLAYKDNRYAAAINNSAVSTSSTMGAPTGVTQLNIGHRNGSLPANAWFKKIMYWPQRLINNEVRAFSK